MSRIESPPRAEVESDVEVDYAPLVAGSFRAAILLALTQVISSLVIANFVGGIVRIGFWFEVIPYLEIWTDGTSFVTIVTWSTVAAVAVTCLGLLHALVRRRDKPLFVDGYATGIAMAGLLIVLQLIQDRRQPYEVIDTWVALQAAAGLLATTMIFFGFRPGEEDGPKAGPQGPRHRRGAGATQTEQ